MKRPERLYFHSRVKIPERSRAVYTSVRHRKPLTAFLNESFCSLFLMTEPDRAQVDVAAKATVEKIRAKMTRRSIRFETGARKVEYKVIPYTATFGLNN